jgi:hypothetical protein
MNSSSSECSVYNSVSGLVYAYPFAAYPLSTPINSNYPLGSWSGYSFSIAPALPSGLSINSSTGIISGTPTAFNASAPSPDSFLITANGPSGQIYSTTIQILAMNGFEVNNTTWAGIDACLGGSNPCNLQGMVTKLATTGGDMLVTIKAGHYFTEGPLFLQRSANSNLIIVGESAATTIIDGNNSFEGFSTGSNIQDLGFGNLEIRNMYKSNGAGSAMYVTSMMNTLGIYNCIFRNNHVTSAASSWGGAIYLSSVPTTIQKTQFISNSIQSGMNAWSGAIDISNADVSIYDSSFVSNAASSTGMSSNGGAIFFSGAGRTLNINNTYFGSNTATSTSGSANGGAITISTGSFLNVTGSVFTSNTCNASMAGGYYCQGGAINFADSSGTLAINRSSFVSNGIAGDTAQGSAIFSIGTTVLRNSTIAFNTITASTNGSAALFVTANPAHLLFSTLVQNSTNIAALSAGIYSGWSIDMAASIIAGNYNYGGSQVINCDGIAYSTHGYNISDTQIPCNIIAGSDRQFGYASINLSNTLTTPIPTLALLSGSPAINYIPNGLSLGAAGFVEQCAGGFGMLDNRGYSRGTGGTGCDIGAYEY